MVRLSNNKRRHSLVTGRAGRCRMDIVLLSEVIKEQDLWAYPYNALRNQALARADTDVSHPSACGLHPTTSWQQMGPCCHPVKDFLHPYCITML